MDAQAPSSRDIQTERIEFKAGNEMLNQLEPSYFGVVCLFIFNYCSGMPDMPGFTRRPRYGRTDDAPRIEAAAWVKVTSMRIELSLSCDWSFGFVTRKY